MEGRVEKLLVRRGQSVEEGEVIAELRTKTLDFELLGAKAELSFRGHELEELIVTKPREIEQARSRMAASKALKEFTEFREKRARELVLSRAISEDELQDRLSAAEAAAQRYIESQAAYELATSGKWDEQIEQMKARIAVQDYVIKRLEDDIDQHTIRPPFTGYVTEEHTEVGQWLAKGDPVVEMIDLQHVEVDVSVLETYVSQLRKDETTAWVEVPALGSRRYSGRVVAIVNQADERSRSFPVKVRIDENQSDEGTLKPGMFARVTFNSGDGQRGLMIPKDALVPERDSPIVWVVESGESAKLGTVRLVSVELGEADGDMIEVRGALRPGELVVVEGNERIDPTSTVQVISVREARKKQATREPAKSSADNAGKQQEAPAR
jgi:RND family efflux transporter MFP subunit